MVELILHMAIGLAIVMAVSYAFRNKNFWLNLLFISLTWTLLLGVWSAARAVSQTIA